MLRKLIVVISGLLGVTVGTLITNFIFSNNYFPNINAIVLRLIVTIIITLLFLLLSLLFSSKLVSVIKKIEEKLSNTPMSKVVFTTIGLILGLLVAALLSLATSSIVSIPIITSSLSGLFYLVFGYLGFILGYRRGGEFLGLFTNRLPSRSRNEDKKLNNKNFVCDKVVDSSALIDSRIHDVAETGFLEGKVIVPEFVLKELQLISDSEDPIKRAKGRLGLDCVEDLQKIDSVNLVIDNDYKYKEHDGVDGLLISYAKKNKCAIITTDYNLNKLATVQSIKVLNVNDLSNAVKPILTAGEKLTVNVQREGKENNQGIAYTEDGTMIVVENGKKSVGKKIEVEVQSVLQTSSGRIIFTKII
ncbi:TRAM domain-containing protein [Gemella sp. GH3]|uniref:PIN/TRAM domain-containing protein n=1 Tax=unclassified Gemella TaxID=2624949 RepID=UPI0015D0B6A2|nr:MULTISPECIES: TRAM domain-containing protein [unclassified Gemella]MBF0713863.1 TRAM domain-containing protein [Gemella sp. GH3.1]NYS50815.1 TRAM domain-containing protein [Gemella sp. GH3]